MLGQINNIIESTTEAVQGGPLERKESPAEESDSEDESMEPEGEEQEET